MKLYLVQHGEAEPKEANPERPLTEKGLSDVKKAASLLANSVLKVDMILHSGKKRAEQTARTIADTAHLAAGL